VCTVVAELAPVLSGVIKSSKKHWLEEIAVDFNEALGGGMEKGDIVLLVSSDAIEPV
jgi:hypothetical protein